MNTPSILAKNEYYEYLIENVKNYVSYYAGGTLCIDHNDRVYFFNLNETVYDTKTEETNLLSINAVKLLFNLYLNTKGKTEYYKEKLSESCIRHLVD